MLLEVTKQPALDRHGVIATQALFVLASQTLLLLVVAVPFVDQATVPVAGEVITWAIISV